MLNADEALYIFVPCSVLRPLKTYSVTNGSCKLESTHRRSHEFALGGLTTEAPRSRRRGLGERLRRKLPRRGPGPSPIPSRKRVLEYLELKTKKPCYRKDDRAMRPIYTYKLFTPILFTLMVTILCADFDSERI